MFKTSYDNVLSVSAIEPSDWTKIQMAIGKERNIELNVSCPNLDSHDDTTTWENFSRFPDIMQGNYCIVKIPPNSPEAFIDRLVGMGYKHIHASNTSPQIKAD